MMKNMDVKNDKKLPKTWEEFCENYPTEKAEYFINSDANYQEVQEEFRRQVYYDRNILPSKQAAEAHLALMQLHQLRDCYRQGWLPDWNDGTQMKYVIYSIRGEFSIYLHANASCFLSFQDEKRANDFLTNFRELIEQAGDLI